MVYSPRLQPDVDQPARDNIWGTTVNIAETQKRFQRFLDEFEQDGKLVYPGLLEELRETEVFSLNLNCANLLEFDQTLYNQLVRYPTEVRSHPATGLCERVVQVMELLDWVVTNAYQRAFGEEPEKPIQVRPFGIDNVVGMRDLDPSDIDRLVVPPYRFSD